MNTTENPVPESLTYQRLTPILGTPDRGSIEMNAWEAQQEIEAAEAIKRRLQAELSRKRRYTKPWEALGKQIAEQREKVDALRKQNRIFFERATLAKQEDIATTAANPLKRLEVLGDLGIIKNPLARKIALAQTEAERQGVPSDIVPKVAEHAAQFLAFAAEQTLEECVRFSVSQVSGKIREQELTTWVKEQSSLSDQDRRDLLVPVRSTHPGEVSQELVASIKAKALALISIRQAEAEEARKAAEEREAKDAARRAEVKALIEAENLPAIKDLPDGTKLNFFELPRGPIDVKPQKLPKWKKDNDIVSALTPAAGIDQTRGVLTGVHIAEVKDEGRVAVAADGRILVRVPYEGNLEAEKTYSTGEMKGATKGALIDANYPNWQQVIPKEDVAQVIELTEDKLARIMGAFRVSRLNDRGSMPVIFEGKQGFAPALLLNCVEALRKAGYLKMSLALLKDSQGSQNPALILTENKDAFAVIMPLRIEQMNDTPHVAI